MTDYISITETNKLIRKVLKESFPGVKFSVQSAAAVIQWADQLIFTGPTDPMQNKSRALCLYSKAHTSTA